MDLDLVKEYQAAQKAFLACGLSQYEAKAYVALVANGYGNADTISETAGIPRTSAYKVLESLKAKGFAYSSRGRPRIYRPEDPEKLKSTIIQSIGQAFDRLSEITQTVAERGEPQLVFTVSGEARVIKKISELLDSAQGTFTISSPVIGRLNEALKRRFEQAAKRGVQITCITEPGHRLTSATKVVWKKNLIATDVIADGCRALIAAPDLSACGYVDNVLLAQHLEHFLHILERTE